MTFRRMHITTLCVWLALVFFMAYGCSRANAQLPDSNYTQGRLNCRWWNDPAPSNPSMTLIIRGGYVIGIGDVWDEFVEPKLGVYPHATVGEISEGISAICEPPQKAAIPLVMVIVVFRKQVTGESQEEIERTLAVARKFAAESTQPKPSAPTKGTK